MDNLYQYSRPAPACRPNNMCRLRLGVLGRGDIDPDNVFFDVSLPPMASLSSLVLSNRIGDKITLYR